MDHRTFVNEVAQRAGVSVEQADQLAGAVLATLADWCTGGEALDLAARLPEPLAQVLRPRPGEEAGDRFDAAEFIRRVSQRAGVDASIAQAGTRAVFITGRRAVTSGEFDDVLARLPRDYRELVEPALAPGVTRPAAGVTPPRPTPATVRFPPRRSPAR